MRRRLATVTVTTLAAAALTAVAVLAIAAEKRAPAGGKKAEVRRVEKNQGAKRRRLTRLSQADTQLYRAALSDELESKTAAAGRSTASGDLTAAASLIVPGFEVEVADSEGPTTLFAVRNTSDDSIDVNVDYYGEQLTPSPLRSDAFILGPQQTLTQNVRSNLDELYVTDGFATGLIVITQAEGATNTDASNLVGDYFRIDPGGDFATGDRLVGPADLCRKQELRFVDFGDGSELRIMVDNPQGEATPSFTYAAYNEAGAELVDGEFFTSDHLNVIDIGELDVGEESFGTVVFDFQSSGGGFATAKYSAFGRYAVELNAACLDEAAIPAVVVPDDTADISAAVAGLTTGGTVIVRAQATCYSITDMIHINTSNISLLGEQGACLRLADEVNRPVILIGSSDETVDPADRIFDIRVSGFLVDGNSSGQSGEDAVGLPNVKNNGIGVRGAERVFLERLSLKNARSGGLVISQQSSKIFVREATFADNFFDGLAIDGAHEVQVEHFVAEENGFSGVSIDTGSSRLQIRDGLIQKNGDNGLFIRFSKESQLSELTLVDNCNYGVFASHANPAGAEGLVEIDLSQLKIFRNKSGGFFWATTFAQGSDDNFLTNSRVAGNGGPGPEDEILGIESASIIAEQNTLNPGFRTDGPTNRTCS